MRTVFVSLALAILAAVATLGACGDTGGGTTVYFDLAHANTPATYWNYPFPSDLRLDDNGAPDLAAFPNPRNVPILDGLLAIVPQRRGWPVMPAGYFRFTAPLKTQITIDQVLDAGPIYLV